LFSVLRESLEDVSRRIISWREEGGRVKRRGRGVDIVVDGGGLVG